MFDFGEVLLAWRNKALTDARSEFKTRSEAASDAQSENILFGVIPTTSLIVRHTREQCIAQARCMDKKMKEKPGGASARPAAWGVIAEDIYTWTNLLTSACCL